MLKPTNFFLNTVTPRARFRSNGWHRLLLLVTVAFGWNLALPAHGQLFGARSVGNPINSPQNRNSASNSNSPGANAGLLDGSERFVRGNRSRSDFVGSDRNEQSGFVGAGQAIGVGRVPAATEGLRVDSSDAQRLNRPLPTQQSKGIYYPRLELAFEVPNREISLSETSDEQRLRTRLAAVTGESVELSISARTATLRGRVPSERTAQLAEQLLSFEPGIDRIHNELQVAR